MALRILDWDLYMMTTRMLDLLAQPHSSIP